MKQLGILFKLGVKFFQKYFFQYLKLLFPMLLLGSLVFLFVFAMILGIYPVIFALLTLVIGLPCFCFAFWRGFLITYSLCYAANDFINKTPCEELKYYYLQAKDKEKSFALYISFCAILTIIFYIPTVLVAIRQPIAIDPYIIMNSALVVGKVMLLNTIIIIPFLNFFCQAYYFKKEDENFIQLFLNCYKKLDRSGILIAILFVMIGTIVSLVNAILYILTFAILNIFAYSVNTFWYYSKK